MTRIEVQPAVWSWMIRESQIDPHDIDIRFDKFHEWVSGELLPTYKQLQDFTQYLGIPFGYAFLDEPPKSDIIKSEFRTIGDKIPKVSKNLKQVISDMNYKQGWVSEYRQKEDLSPVLADWYVSVESDDYFELAKQIKEYINLPNDWFIMFKNTNEAYKYLRQILEKTGFLTMQSGVVGNNKRRVLNLDEFRGFALYDDYAPLIFINSKDSIKGKIFTLIHEAIHLFFKNDDVSLGYNESEHNVERKINNITAEILMPKDVVLSRWKYHVKQKDQIKNINTISDEIFVSSLSLSIRLYQLKLISNKTVKEIQNQTDNILLKLKPKESGGNYWNDYFAKYSNKFLQEVVLATEKGEITHSDAFQLLDVKAKNYIKIKEKTLQYV